MSTQDLCGWISGRQLKLKLLVGVTSICDVFVNRKRSRGQLHVTYLLELADEWSATALRTIGIRVKCDPLDQVSARRLYCELVAARQVCITGFKDDQFGWAAGSFQENFKSYGGGWFDRWRTGSRDYLKIHRDERNVLRRVGSLQHNVGESIAR